jgi:hypothetical protein
MNRKVFIIKLVHSLIFWFQLACLIYILYAIIFRAFNFILIIPIAAIVLNGVALLLNNGRCPFTNLAEKYGAEKGSVTDLFLPDIIARNIFRFCTPFFVLEMIVLAIRYFAGI